MNVIKGSKFLLKLVHIYTLIKRHFTKKLVINFFGHNNDHDEEKIPKVFVINLDSQNTRWKQVQNEFKRLEVKGGKSLDFYLERESAVNGELIKTDSFHSDEVEKLYNLKEHFFIDPDPRLAHIVKNKDIRVCMSSAEIAVTMSHINVWKKIVSQDIPYALVLEDDIFFDKNFSELANNMWEEIPVDDSNKKSFDLLYLSYKEVDSGAEKTLFSKHLFKPIRGYWWLSGYILSAQGAKKLLSLLPVCGPIDMWINLQFDKLSTYAVFRSIIHQRKDMKSSNSYSIMPILSRMGINKNIEELNDQFKITKKPIFAIGLNKTATTSLHFALSILGYKCCHWISDDFSDKTAKLIKNNLPLPFDAYTDVESITENFKELDIQYPNAVFILTTRNIDDWIGSRIRHVTRNKIENKQGASHNWTEIEVESWRDERKKHHEIVKNYFMNKKDKLLVFDICGGDGWDKLCTFLKLPVPEASFPNVDPLIKLEALARSINKRIPIIGRNTVALEHDAHPWIKRPENIENYTGTKEDIEGFGYRTGSYSPEIKDVFVELNKLNWDLLDNTFPYNLVMFRPNNVQTKSNSGIEISLKNEAFNGYEITSGGLKSTREFQYGRFEIVMKPISYAGLISAFFLYRIDPWQEIDIEFLGNDTSKMLVNVYFNPGDDGTVQNYGTSGTPVLIELGFDASLDFHNYVIEWDPNEIRWFVDNNLVHVRKTGNPTPIPNLQLKAFINLWVPGNSQLAGKYKSSKTTKMLEVKSVILSSWYDN